MAVRITFDDNTEKVYDSAESVKQEERRGPYHLTDSDGKLVVLVPDFGVRLLAIE